MHRLWICGALPLLFWAGSSHAQPPSAQPGATAATQPAQSSPTPPPRTSGYREHQSGWFLGAGMGAGMATVWADGDSFSSTAMSLYIRIGGRIDPRLALWIEFWSEGHDGQTMDDPELSQLAMALTGTYRLSPRFWLTGGVAQTWLSNVVDRRVEESTGGYGIMAGMGYELFGWTRFSIDLTARMLVCWYQPSDQSVLDLSLGFTWY